MNIPHVLLIVLSFNGSDARVIQHTFQDYVSCADAKYKIVRQIEDSRARKNIYIHGCFPERKT